MQFAAIKQQLRQYQSQGLTLFASSSFQTQSAALLHIISRIDRQIPIFFMNTGYHFAETIGFSTFATGTHRMRRKFK